jgi:nucleoside-diphosphate-sugar epimerase
MKIFLAGATGIIGRRLIPQLLSAGHAVTGMARSTDKADLVRSLGAEPVIVDVFDVNRLAAAVSAARPELVIHQLTALPDQVELVRQTETLERNARIRREGTHNLIAAALQSGARRIVAQSVAWLYASGALPHGEADPLDLEAEGTRAITVDGVKELERLVLSTPSLEGVVLRFGYFYGPETWNADRTGEVSVHIEAATNAIILAATQGAPGIYNIVDDGGSATNTKARNKLGWNPSHRF